MSLFRKSAGFSCLLALFFILSQWIVLAHASEHLIQGNNTHCAVCALNDHNDEIAVASCLTHAVISPAYDKPACQDVNFRNSPNDTRRIRAPPPPF